MTSGRNIFTAVSVSLVLFFLAPLGPANAQYEDPKKVSSTHSVKTAKATHELSQRIGVEMPITEGVYQMLYEGKTPQQLLQELMDRNNEGQLGNREREELEAVVELSEKLSLVRSEAFLILGKRPE